LAFLHGERQLRRPEPPVDGPAPEPPDLADVVGQEDARHALEIAAAGGHHVLLVGPPGTGKTMLAQRFAGLLPRLAPAEALALAAIRSVAGRLPASGALSTLPPFVAPHHSSSMAALVGGGSGMARPGAVSLAHRGVLFIDEAPEWGAKMLDALRTPLEEGEVRLSRAEGTVHYPARFQLVLAANPCPCAPAHDRDCICPSMARRRYLGRMSGPLLDRVDLRARMFPVTALIATSDGAESTAAVRARVLAARAAAAERWAERGWRTNAEVPGPVLRTRFALPRKALRPLDAGLRAGELTARGADRALRVAWTLADLAGRDSPDEDLVAAALYFRDRRAA
jgi:magnesium chelatase family protein